MKCIDVIEKWRTDHDMYMKDFCSGAGISQASYIQWKRDNRIPTGDALVKICNYTGMTPNTVLGPECDQRIFELPAIDQDAEQIDYKDIPVEALPRPVTEAEAETEQKKLDDLIELYLLKRLQETK